MNEDAVLTAGQKEARAVEDRLRGEIADLERRLESAEKVLGRLTGAVNMISDRFYECH